MEKSRHGAFVYAQKVLKHSLFLFLLINLLSISPDISASTTLLEQKYTLNLSSNPQLRAYMIQKRK